LRRKRLAPIRKMLQGKIECQTPIDEEKDREPLTTT
jgi:hypothetical protein